MYLFNTALCQFSNNYHTRLPFILRELLCYIGGDRYAAMALLLIVSILLMVLPTLFYWQYRCKSWFFLITGLVVFVFVLDYFMRSDKGGVLDTFVGAEMLFGLFYILPVLCMRASERVSTMVGGSVSCRLRRSDRLTLMALVVFVQLCFFLMANALYATYDEVVQGLNYLVNGIFFLWYPIDAGLYRDQINFLLAFFPTLILANVLRAWFGRRLVEGREAVPWPLYFVATSGVLCLVLSVLLL